MEKRFLFILSKSPHGCSSARESTDAILAACAFGQDVKILALGQGITQFLKLQNPDALKLKSTSAMLESLPLYGCDEFFALESELTSMEFSANDLVIPVKTISTQELASLIEGSDVVLNY